MSESDATAEVEAVARDLRRLPTETVDRRNALADRLDAALASLRAPCQERPLGHEYDFGRRGRATYREGQERPLAQRQGSLTDQLHDIKQFANRTGAYDAADFIERHMGDSEQPADRGDEDA